MKKTARPYVAAVVLGALLVPSAPLVPPAAATPPVPFLLAVRDGELHDVLAGFVPRLTNNASPRSVVQSARTATPAAARPPVRSASAPKISVQKTLVHVVVAGDTLWSLANRSGMSVSALAQTNGISETSTLRLGQRLAVTSSAGRAVTPSVSSRQTIIHTVASGDTLWSLARRYGTSVGVLLAANGLTEMSTIRVGQRLTVPASAAAPSTRGTTQGASRTIVVQSGQTLSGVAEAYGVSTRALVEANGLRSAHTIRAGQRLTIPRSANLPPIRTQLSAATRALANALQRGFFAWPTRGVLTSRFGWRWRRHHNGIDIAAPRGSPIYAARGGLVSFAGWYYGYGLTVIVDHGGGVISMYGHASRLLVRGGQAVSAGQLIARVGCTGSCTGSHVHFEVRVNGRPVNPLQYL